LVKAVPQYKAMKQTIQLLCKGFDVNRKAVNSMGLMRLNTWKKIVAIRFAILPSKASVKRASRENMNPKNKSNYLLVYKTIIVLPV